MAYLESKRDGDGGLLRTDIDAALEGFWRQRAVSAPTQGMLREHVRAEDDYVNDLRKR